MRFAIAFGLCAGVLAALAAGEAPRTEGARWALVAAEGYLAACFAAVAAAYGLRGVGVDVERHLLLPGRSAAIRGVVMPYLALGAIALHLGRRFGREASLGEAAPGLWIGRLPAPSERDSLRGAGIGAILNLCWEFPGLAADPGIEAARVPILDGAPPSPRQFEEAARWVGRWRAEGRSVLVHCAQGHGRSATILASCLVRLGLAPGAEQALAMVAAARPLARPSREQREALGRDAAGIPPAPGPSGEGSAER